MVLRDVVATHAPKATILIRFLAGAVFLSEGIQKFLFPALLAAGRFARIGIPHPEVMGPFVGALETLGGALLLLGLLTRPAALVLAIDISVAIVTTKIPILLAHDLGPFHVARLARYGFWSMASEARADWSMLVSCLFLLVVGAGPWSLDAVLPRGRAQEEIPFPVTAGAR